ncbi:hypothetical protein [Duganella sp. P38]|uniref:hypothetical protein n=1 Tax=Duganella sp. P38 TaxID=3423949 RepID=UPI003D78BD86
MARRLNAQISKNPELLYLSAQALIAQSSTIGSVATAPIHFDNQGHVLNVSRLSRFTGRRTKFDRMILLDTSSPPPRQLYHVADWTETHLGPSLCTLLDSRRYEQDKDFTKKGNFGCKEWGRQLYDSSRPYIDVTTYTATGNFIGQFMGWARIVDAPKPIIGMQDNTWMCLHECPAGETPGVIKNIKTWTSKHGYAIPVPPAFQPEYPDKNYDDETYCESSQEIPQLMTHAIMYE